MKLTIAIAALLLVTLLVFAGGNAAPAEAHGGFRATGRVSLVASTAHMYWIDGDRGTIRRANLDGTGTIEDLVTSGQPTSLALDPTAGRLYWTDSAVGKIRWAEVQDFSKIDELNTLGRPVDLALDSADGKLYWTDSAPGRIRRANLGGGGPMENLVLAGQPTSLALDLANRRMYWTDGATGKIRRARMDRSVLDPVDDMVSGLVWPGNLALDSSQGQMYWTEWSAPGRIRRASMDGADAFRIENLVTSDLPTGLALDLPANRMYWTDLVTKKIRSSNLDGTGFIKDLLTSADGLNTPLSIVLAVATEQASLQSVPQIYWVDEATNQVQRTNPDDYRVVEDLIASTSARNNPGSIAVDLGGGKVYWTDDGVGQIRRANQDGSGMFEILKAGLADPVGIALDLNAGHLYWADRHQGAIYRSNENINRDGLQISAKTLAYRLDRPYQIALDKVNNHMYWTERGGSKIRRADLDGGNVTDINFGLVAPLNPYGLALDPVAGKMYWTERSTVSNGDDVIARADLDGQNGQIVITSAYHSLSGIAVDVNDGRIYWTDEKTGTIRRTDPEDPNRAVETVVTDLSSPEGIALARPYMGSTRLALAALYRATGGPEGEWENSDNWLGDEPLGEWHGVTTADEWGESTTDLVGLDLSNNGLTGEIPAMLGNLNHLESLDLSGNRLTGPIPEGLAEGFPILKVLNLSSNRLSGAIPAQLGNQHLTRLDLSRNQLAGPIPEELGRRLASLRQLDLSNNLLHGSIPQQLSSFATLAGCETIGQTVLNQGNLDGWRPYSGNLDNLEVLDLSDNRLSGAIPPMLCSLANLQVLDLDHNRLRGTIPVELGRLTELRALRLNGQSPFNNYIFSGHEEEERLANCTDDCYLHGAIPSQLGQLAKNKLEVLDLSDNRLSEQIPPELGGLLTVRSRLTTLDLSKNQLAEAIPVELGRLKHLTSLDLSHNALEENIPYLLGNLINLETLDLSHNQLEGGIPPSLGRLSRLTKLDLSWNDLSGEIPSELGNRYRLETLLLEGNQSFEGCAPHALMEVENTSGLPAFCASPDDLDKERAILEIVYLGLRGAPNTEELAAVYEAIRDEAKDYNEDFYSSTLSAFVEGVDEELWLSGQFDIDSHYDQFLDDHPQLYLDQLQRLAGYVERYKSFSGWADRDGWLTSASVGAWYGVTTDAQGYVSELNLRDNRLRGAIPPELARLDRLSKLNLLGNNLSGCIPRELHNPSSSYTPLARSYKEAPGQTIGIVETAAIFMETTEDVLIEEFGLESFRGIGDYVPVFSGVTGTFGFQEFLRETFGLGLALCAPTPARKPATSLEHQTTATDKQALLDIYDYYVTQMGNPEKEFAGWLKVLEAEDEDCPRADIRLHGVRTELIDGCRRVTHLKLDRRELEGGIPEAIGDLGQLRELNLSRNKLSGGIQPALGNLQNLEVLALNGLKGQSRLSGEIPAELGNMNGLQKLFLHETDVNGELPYELANLKHLSEVNFDGSQLTGCVPPPLRSRFTPSLFSFIDKILTKLIGKLPKAVKWASERGSDQAKRINDAFDDATRNAAIRADIPGAENWNNDELNAFRDEITDEVSNMTEMVGKTIDVHDKASELDDSPLSRIPGYDAVKASFAYALNLSGGVAFASLNLTLDVLSFLAGALDNKLGRATLDLFIKPGAVFSNLGDVELTC